MSLRKLLFWSHLIAGVIVGLFVAFLAITGSMLAFEPQIVRWFEARLLSGAAGAPGASRASGDRSACLDLGGLLMSVQQQTGRDAVGVQLFADPQLPVHVQFGKEEVLFVDACTGRVVHGAASRVRSFLTVVRNLHESAALGHERGGLLRDVKNAANVGCVFLILTGLILWVPRQWKAAHIKAVTVVRMKLRGRARDWNLHNVAGFWLAVPLLAITGTGAIISYPWADRLLYRLSGSAPMEHEARGVNHEGKRLPGFDDDRRDDGEREREHGGHDDARAERADAPIFQADLASLDRFVEMARQQRPGWRSIRFRIPDASTSALSFAFDDDEETGGNGGLKSELTIDRVSGRILRWTPAEREPRGRRWQMYARTVHTGQAFGLPGQCIAFISAGAALLLVWTGFSLGLRRFNAWRGRIRRR